MAAHRFVYTLSGVELSEPLKAKISEEIALAVTRVLVGENPTTLSSVYQSPHPVCGGAHRKTDDDTPGPDTPANTDPATP